ncbi:MAG: hydroxymethylglutaryl-CoA reductase [Gemmatimonadaceae bacterium]
MPISYQRAREIARRLSRGHAFNELSDRLAPVAESRRPLPPRVPRQGDWSADARAERIGFLEERGVPLDHLAGRAPEPDPSTLQGNIESYIGMTMIPTGLIGPLRINGLHSSGDYYVPLTTSEGALVASYDRGARLLTLAGGASTLTTTEHVQRAPGFLFETMAEAALFAAWAVGEFDRFREVAATRTRHGELADLMTHIAANHVYLIFAFNTGDAAGQNMVTLCTAAICADILERAPIKPRTWFLEANMSGDKKATTLSFLYTRGRNATAEAVIPRSLLLERMRTTPEQMAEYWRVSFIGGVQTGSIGVSGHISNGIAALFLATGQDAACISEASVGVTRMEVTGDGALYAAVVLPNLIVGTVGGGTRLPTARECLRILHCDGDGRAARLAEICAATALAGELSIVAALCSGDFARAHETLGRPPLAPDA